MSRRRPKRKNHELLHADIFAINAMHCPGCRVGLEKVADLCSQCGYSFDHALKKFPFEAPEMTRFIDPDGHISGEDAEAIEGAALELSRRFPQPRICFCIVDLEEDIDPREFGFWLLNASPVDGPEEEKLRPWTILLLIDHANGRASVSAGYAIAPFLSDERWEALLLQQRPFFASKKYGEALFRFVDTVIGVFSEGAERTERLKRWRKLENVYPERWWK